MTSSISRVGDRSPITIAAGFIGAFIVGSLAVQLVRSQTAALPAAPSSSDAPATIEPVIAGPAALWSTLGEQDITLSQTQKTGTKSSAATAPSTALVVGSEATLWSTLGER